MNKRQQQVEPGSAAGLNAHDFRRLALGYPGAVESSHMNHPDFRIGGKIFATLGYPEAGFGMVKLTPEQQENFLTQAPAVFTPCAGAWGRQGSTSVRLASVSPQMLGAALAAAAGNAVAAAKKQTR